MIDEEMIDEEVGEYPAADSPTETQRALGRSFRAMAARKGLSGVQVAERSGLSKQCISKLFGGGGCSWSTAERVAGVLRTTIGAALDSDARTPGRSGPPECPYL